MTERVPLRIGLLDGGGKERENLIPWGKSPSDWTKIGKQETKEKGR